MPSPYTVDPPVGSSSTIQGAADGIFYGWLGLVQDATFQTSVETILENGLTNFFNAIQPSLQQTITDGIIAANVDPTTIAAAVEAITDGVTAALMQSSDAGYIPSSNDIYVQAVTQVVTHFKDLYGLDRATVGQNQIIDEIFTIAEKMIIERNLP